MLTDNIREVDNSDCKILINEQVEKKKVFKFESSTETKIFISELPGLAWALDLKGLCFKSTFSRQVSVLLQEVATLLGKATLPWRPIIITFSFYYSFRHEHVQWDISLTSLQNDFPTEAKEQELF